MFNSTFRITAAIGLLAATITDAITGPLQTESVASDAKWVVHLDLDAFRESRLGSHLISNFLQPKIDETGFLKKANLSISLTNVSSVTAYGPNFEKDGEGVLLLKTSADVNKDLDTLVGLSSLSGDGEKKVTMVTQTPVPIYQMKDDLLVAWLGNGRVLAAKSRDQLDRAQEILAGKHENLAKSDAFKHFPKVANTFFFLGMAEGLNEKTDIPPQAQVLRETDGGRLVIGENEKSVFINLVFRGKNEESTTKIQQVLQGIVALISMTQQNNEAAELASSAKISGEGRNVSVNLQFPTAKAIDRVNKHVKINVHDEEVGVELKFSDKEEETNEAEK